MNRIILLSICLSLTAMFACEDTPPNPVDGDLRDIDYNPVEYSLEVPEGFAVLEIPEDNPMTVDGVDLGRHLFYDPVLSADSTMSCSSCHLPEGSFTDNKAVSAGIDAIEGRRSSMSLLNVGYSYISGDLFWDGRTETLEAQALLPVEDELELHDSWENVVEKLQRSSLYPEKFRKAFGINNTAEIDRQLAAKAIAQFERSLVSSGTSRWDLFVNNKIDMTDEEQEGFDMFFDEDVPGLPDAQCFHCHEPPLFASNNYFNNGIEDVDALEDFMDLGRGEITGNTYDNGKFKVPSLRNIHYSAPYMHDGRFQTLREVIDDYNAGGHGLINEDENIRAPFQLNEQHIDNLLLFIEMFRDTVFLNDPRYKNPF